MILMPPSFNNNIFLLCLEYEQKCETKYEQKCETKYETQYEEQCETQYEEQCETKYDTQYEEKCETVSHDFNNEYTLKGIELEKLRT